MKESIEILSTSMVVILEIDTMKTISSYSVSIQRRWNNRTNLFVPPFHAPICDGSYQVLNDNDWFFLQYICLNIITTFWLYFSSFEDSLNNLIWLHFFRFLCLCVIFFYQFCIWLILFDLSLQVVICMNVSRNPTQLLV